MHLLVLHAANLKHAIHAKLNAASSYAWKSQHSMTLMQQAVPWEQIFLR